MIIFREIGRIGFRDLIFSFQTFQIVIRQSGSQVDIFVDVVFIVHSGAES
jgi:hypothetical protein